MTEQEAIDVLDGFHKAFRALNRMKAQQAVNTLLITRPSVSSGSSRAFEFSLAIAKIRSAFDELESKGIKFPSN
jgi:hypothetical protein